MAINKKKEDEVGVASTPTRSSTTGAGQGTTQNVNNTTGQFTSQWAAQKNQALNAYLNRDPFKYDFNADALYQHYKDKYIQQGQQAMQDTMGQAAALTGGYGSSYAQNVGQQAYNQHLSQLNDVVPELYRMAYEKYQNEGNELLQRYGLFADEEAQDYSRWYQAGRDNVADSQWKAEFEEAKRQYDQSYDYQVGRDNVADSQWKAEFEEAKRQYDQSYDYQVGRDNVADQRYNDETAYTRDQEKALALAYAGDYSGIAQLYGMTNEQAAAFATANGYTTMTNEKATAMAMTGDYSGIATLYGMSNDQAKAWAQANGITPESASTSQMTKEKATAMAMTGDYSGIATLYGMSNDQAKAWAQANGITPESASASQMTEDKAMAMAANGDYSGLAQWLDVPVDYAKAWYIKEYGDPTAEEPIEKPIYSHRDPETGNYIYYYDGKQVEHEAGVSPVTGTVNPDIYNLNKEGKGTFGITGYQPNNIGGVPLKEAGWKDTINGHEQNVWEKTDDKSLWMWDDTKGKYVEYEGLAAVDTERIKQFEQSLYYDAGYRTATDVGKKALVGRRIDVWLNNGRLNDNEASTLMAKYGL